MIILLFFPGLSWLLQIERSIAIITIIRYSKKRRSIKRKTFVLCYYLEVREWSYLAWISPNPKNDRVWLENCIPQTPPLFCFFSKNFSNPTSHGLRTNVRKPIKYCVFDSVSNHKNSWEWKTDINNRVIG